MVGQGDRGRAVLDEALAVARRMGHPWGVNQALRFLGVEALQRGEIEQAKALLRESLDGWRTLGAPGVRETCWMLGYGTLAARDTREAIAWFRESVVLCQERSDRSRMGRSIQGVAVAMLVGDDRTTTNVTRAVRLLGAAEQLRGNLRGPMPDVEQSYLERTVEAARAALGDEGFSAAWADGQAMSPDDAVAHALDETASA